MNVLVRVSLGERVSGMYLGIAHFKLIYSTYFKRNLLILKNTDNCQKFHNLPYVTTSELETAHVKGSYSFSCFGSIDSPPLSGTDHTRALVFYTGFLVPGKRGEIQHNSVLPAHLLPAGFHEPMNPLDREIKIGKPANRLPLFLSLTSLVQKFDSSPGSPCQ